MNAPIPLKRYGYTSVKAEQSFVKRNAEPGNRGVAIAHIYLTPQGTEVRVNFVGNTTDPKLSGYKWDDMVCVGEVSHWVSTIR